MPRAARGEEDSRRETRPRTPRKSQSRQLAAWLNQLTSRLKPTEYVDASDAPDPPESPYRARLTVPIEHSLIDVEVCERDVVRGEMRVLYEVRCPCGKRWFNVTPDRVQLCPRCGSAVLLQPPA